MQRASRFRLFAAALAAISVFSAVPAGATDLSGPSPEPLPFGGFTSPNIEWIRNIRIDGEAVYTHVAYRIGPYLYYDGLQRFSILDVKDPLNPKLLSQIDRPGPGPWPSSPSPPNNTGRSVTNGEIAVVPGGHPDSFLTSEPANTALYVFDISDKGNPKRIGQLVLDEFLVGFFCVMDCKWIYDRTGRVIDLRDPSRPRLTDADWRDALRFNSVSTSVKSAQVAELIEIAPGILLTGSVPMYLLDARKDPRRPRVVARSDGTPRSYGDVAWPGFDSGTVALSSDPNTNFPICDNGQATGGSALDHGFTTWDASRWKALGIITPVETYRPRNGTYMDGDPPISLDRDGGACTVNRFDAHSRFQENGLVAAGAMAHGLKLLRVGANGKIRVAGWFLPYGYGDTGAAFFINDRIVYAVDQYRGIDILRYEGQI